MDQIRDVRWTEEVSLLSDQMQRVPIIRAGSTGEALRGETTLSKSRSNSTIRAYDAQKDKYMVLFKNGRTVEWELGKDWKIWVQGKDRQQWSQTDQEALVLELLEWALAAEAK